jgi:hypothetical protein
MTTQTVTRVDPVSVGKIYALALAAMILIIGIPVAIIIGLFAMMAGPEVGILALVGILIFVIIASALYAAIGFVFGTIGAFIYNVAAGKVGGVKIDLE